jgi:hypothetical protein
VRREQITRVTGPRLLSRRRLKLQLIFTALACVMRTARRADSLLCWISRVKEPLALVTPTPIRLPHRVTSTVIPNDGVMAALACVMRLAARGAHSLARIPSEKESLALVAPSPAPLLATVIVIKRGTRVAGWCGLAGQPGQIFSALACVMRLLVRGADSLCWISRKKAPLALMTPSPASLVIHVFSPLVCGNIVACQNTV